MPEPRDIPLIRWGEALRRDRVARRSSRVRLGAAIAAALAACAAAVTLFWRPRPLLLWNASASVPIGLYAVGAPARLRRGDTVVARAPLWAAQLAAARRYLPEEVPLVKRVAALPGDRVCAVGEAVFVGDRLEAVRRAADAAGRPLPSWTDCVQLADGQFLLLAPGNPDSFDGRYFGVSRREDLVGRATLLWPR